MNIFSAVVVFFVFIFSACNLAAENEPLVAKHIAFKDIGLDSIINKDTLPVVRKIVVRPSSGTKIDTKGVSPDEVVRFAQSLIGVSYLYGSANPQQGFDCSGFITYVFNHFNIDVPRSSIGFTHVEKEIPLKEVRRGDLILFTGTDSTETEVGHMGIVVATADTIKFIHSTSGKAYGVTVTPLNSYYMGRYVKTIRVFDEAAD